MATLDRKLIRDVIHLRGQVVAITLVVACGVASFVAMRSTYDSLLSSQQTYYESYRFAEVFAQLKRAPDSVATNIQQISGVAKAEFRVVADVILDVPGLEEPAKGRIISIPEQRVPMLNDLYLREGRYVEPGRKDEVLVSGAFATANNLKPGSTISAIINGRWQSLQIVGVALSPEYVYEIRSGEMFPDSRRSGVLWMSREVLGPAFNMKGAFNDIVLTLAPGAVEADVIQRVDDVLAGYGGLGAYNRADQVSNRFLSNEIAELQVTGTFIPGIFLAVTAFLIHLVLSRLVATQRQEIAVLKAFGYGNYSIGFHYWKLAGVVILGGVALGIGVGWYFGFKITALYMEFFRFPVLRYQPEPVVIITAVLISLASASIGALAAVRRAVALPPAEAMRPEPPTRFRAGVIERMGFHKVVPTSVRIILRNLERRPGKAMLSILGIALAVGLLVVGFFLYFDTIERIIEVQFNEVQREDISVAFNEPRSSNVKYDLAHLPGVIRVEPYRVVPARLRFQHRSRRTALLGLEAEGDLRRIVARDFQSVRLPPDGLVLTTKLAEILGVKPGESITVEVLEGDRPVRDVVVADSVDELTGLSAYMDRRALNRLLQESATSSGAFMMVDSPDIPALYARLKQTPAVSAVSVPSVALANFNETIAKTINVSTAFLIGFAVIIAFGMVYNGARVALSERGHELASLRVLGFTRGEIGFMLLGEQALLTLIAIPAGMALGYSIAGLITVVIDTELIRFPLVVSARTYALAFLVVTASACLSGYLVQWRLRHLDLVAVLKTRE
ncbi:MAG TPA: FtsX-like permease family protein [Pyrinomonadaceae bacterium]|nr:FtsX-like permease family protein [Pyrinomonadaceae bacterium]